MARKTTGQKSDHTLPIVPNDHATVFAILHALDYDYPKLGNPVSIAVDASLGEAWTTTDLEVKPYLTSNDAMPQHLKVPTWFFQEELESGGDEITDDPEPLYRMRVRSVYELWKLCEKLGIRPNTTMRERFDKFAMHVAGYPEMLEDGTVEMSDGRKRRRLYERRTWEWDFRRLMEDFVGIVGHAAGLAGKRSGPYDYRLPAWLDADKESLEILIAESKLLYREWGTSDRLRSLSKTVDDVAQVLRELPQDTPELAKELLAKAHSDLEAHLNQIEFELGGLKGPSMSGVAALAAGRTVEIVRFWRGERSVDAMTELLKTLANDEHTPIYRLADALVKKLQGIRAEIEKAEDNAKKAFHFPATSSSNRTKELRLQRQAFVLVLTRYFGRPSVKALEYACEISGIKSIQLYKDFRSHSNGFWNRVLPY